MLQRIPALSELYEYNTNHVCQTGLSWLMIQPAMHLSSSACVCAVAADVQLSEEHSQTTVLSIMQDVWPGQSRPGRQIVVDRL